MLIKFLLKKWKMIILKIFIIFMFMVFLKLWEKKSIINVVIDYKSMTMIITYLTFYTEQKKRKFIFLIFSPILIYF